MPSNNEQTLLRDFVTERDETAFRALVEYHIDMVFGCALRRTRDVGLAEEISQNVFTILARKAHRLKAGSGLAGWLHKTTVYETTKALRGVSRRNRKMKALAEHSLAQHGSDVSPEGVLPLVDEAIDELPDDDRRMILLHYFEGRSFRDISQSVGKSEAASQKQASRALAKLEKILRRRGVVASATALVSLLASESAKAAPADIASTISGGALAGASSLATTTLITNTIQTMTYAKTKIALLVATAAAVPIGSQMKSISDLKRDLDVYERRETEFTERGERLAKLEARFAALPAGMMDLGEGESSDLGRDRASLTALSKQSAGIGAGISKGQAEKDSKGEAGIDLPASGTLLSSVAEMMKDPGMRSIIKKTMKVQLEMTYGDLLDHFDLDKNARSELSEALLERQLAMADIGMKRLNGEDGEDGEDGDIDVSKIKATQAEHDAKVKGLIGEERFELFDRFEKSTGERQELATFREALKENGLDLPFETEQKLMAIMYEENHSTTGSRSGSPFGSHTAELSRGIISPEVTASFLADRRETQGRIRTRAAAALTPEQLEAFTRNQESHLKLLQTGLEMHANRFKEMK